MTGQQGTFRKLSVQYILKCGSPMWKMQCQSATSELFFYTIPEKTEAFIIPCDGHRNLCLIPSAIFSLPRLLYHHLRLPPIHCISYQVWIKTWKEKGKCYPMILRGFGGLELARWPLVPKFADSNAAEAVGFFRVKKILSTPSFGREVNPFVPCRRFTAYKRSLNVNGSRAFSGKILRSFLAQVVPPFTTRISGGDTWRCKWERLKTRVCTISLRLQCIRGR